MRSETCAGPDTAAWLLLGAKTVLVCGWDPAEQNSGSAVVACAYADACTQTADMQPAACVGMVSEEALNELAVLQSATSSYPLTALPSEKPTSLACLEPQAMIQPVCALSACKR